MRYSPGDWAIFDDQWCTDCWQHTGPFVGRVVSFIYDEPIGGSSVSYLVDPMGGRTAIPSTCWTATNPGERPALPAPLPARLPALARPACPPACRRPARPLAGGNNVANHVAAQHNPGACSITKQTHSKSTASGGVLFTRKKSRERQDA